MPNMSARNDYEAGIEMVSQFDNVVMTRTFSKIYGLAGMRIGWAYAPAAVCDVLNRIRGPVQCLHACSSTPARRRMRDRAHVERSVAHNEKWQAWLTDEIRKLGLRVDDSVANFVLIHFPQGREERGQGRRVPQRARADPARRRQLRPAGCLRLTVGHRGSQPRCRSLPCANSWRHECRLRQDRADRPGPDRLVAWRMPCKRGRLAETHRRL